MLYYNTVQPELLELLNALMQNDVFENFQLVGGTSLALRIGHRISTDLDFFGQVELDEMEFSIELQKYGEPKILKKSKNILIYSINGIKVDFVNYKYPLLKSPLEIEKIRMASFEDIGAMKLNAICGRGSRKDFIDIYFLLSFFTMRELLEFYHQKYKDGSEFLVLKSLSYFEDANQEDLVNMIEPVSWEEIKNRIISETQNLL